VEKTSTSSAVEESSLDGTVEPRKKTEKRYPVQVEERGNSLILDIGTDFSGDDVDVYDNEEFPVHSHSREDGGCINQRIWNRPDTWIIRSRKA